ncbi:hypothetical protein [Clostridium brassicae]|uniref:DUF5673 domain-containing protein n=1 Tax=Clostridium brassicae TaxID=2999072 RepID=A0ABT4D794_9CLOT|nr:hypothetical protein [Clostridium brassicae]MCY6958165.1 hypothetical protein [Clostridium brassicae]
MFFKENWAPILTIVIPLLNIISNLSIMPYRHGRKLNKMNTSKEYSIFKIVSCTAIVCICLYAIFSKQADFSNLIFGIVLPILFSCANSFVNKFNYSKVTDKGIFFDDGFKKWNSFTSYTWSSPNAILFKGETRLNSFELELIIDDTKKLEMELLLNEYMHRDLLYKEISLNKCGELKKTQQCSLFKSTIAHE